MAKKPRNPVARSPLLRKGGAHRESTSAERTRLKRELREEAGACREDPPDRSARREHGASPGSANGRMGAPPMRDHPTSWAGMAGLLAVAAALLGPPATARPLQDVLNHGTLRVGVALFPPWAMRDPSGGLTGFEVDVAKKLAEDMSLEVEFSVYPWDRIIRGLEAGEIDIIAAGLSITPERALHVAFSRPYATGGTTLATNLETTSNVSSLDDLNDAFYTVAAIAGSAAEELARRLFPRADLQLHENADAATTALLEGEADAYLENEPVPTFLALENPAVVDVPVPEPLLPTPAGFGVAKGDPDFVNFLDAWITAREADTWLPSTHGYWFQTLRWRD